MRNNGNPFSSVTVRDLMLRPFVYIALALIEVRRYGIDSGGISDQYHPIGQLTWKQMQMEYRPIGIKNKF